MVVRVLIFLRGSILFSMVVVLMVGFFMIFFSMVVLVLVFHSISIGILVNVSIVNCFFDGSIFLMVLVLVTINTVILVLVFRLVTESFWMVVEN
jgi:hypothetical protein